MKDVPAELLYVLMFLAIVLFQYLMKRFGPQAPPEPAWDERLEQISEALEDSTLVSPVSASAGGQFGRGAATDSTVSPPQRRLSRGSLLGDRLKIQNAVVVATILGPCRAFEPHDIRQ